MTRSEHRRLLVDKHRLFSFLIMNDDDVDELISHEDTILDIEFDVSIVSYDDQNTI